MNKYIIKRICEMSRLMFLLAVIVCTTTGVIIASDVRSQHLRNTHVTLNGKYDGRTLSSLFQQIEQQSAFRFYYEKAVGEIQGYGVFDVGENNLHELLKTIAERYNLKITQRDSIISVTKVQEQRSGRITGRVADVNGQMLAGASVRIIELNRSVSTDENGNFSIV